MAMTGNELLALVRSGKHPIITCGKEVEEMDSYLEQGMRGRLIDIQDKRDDTLRLIIDLTGFEDHNAPFESSTYYDDRGDPTLTAREAGFYPKNNKECIYIGGSLEIPFTVEEGDAEKLFKEYSDKHDTGATYVQWLEKQVLQNREPNLSSVLEAAGVDLLVSGIRSAVKHLDMPEISVNFPDDASTIMSAKVYAEKYVRTATVSVNTPVKDEGPAVDEACVSAVPTP